MSISKENTTSARFDKMIANGICSMASTAACPRSRATAGASRRGGTSSRGIRWSALGLGLLFLGASSAWAADIKVEADLVKIQRKMVEGANRLFVVALGNGPFKTSIGGAAEKMVSGSMFGSIQLNQVNRDRAAFTSRAFADGSLIFNDGAGTWTGMTMWLTDGNGNTFAASSESNSNGVVVVRAAGDGNAPNRRLNITLPNITKYDLTNQPTVLWLRMPASAGYEGSLTGNVKMAGSDSLCVSAPDNDLTYEDFIALSAYDDYIPLFEDLTICPYNGPTPTRTATWGFVKSMYH